VRGAEVEGIKVFKGVRYGADTAPRRFRPALPPQPWTGVADALAYGPASPQTKIQERPARTACSSMSGPRRLMAERSGR
jgi:para-nitrobenzyl esterase